MYLGVDGGGTKTALCLLDVKGQIIAQTEVPSCYYFTEGISLVERILRRGIDEICEQAGISCTDIRYAFFGLPSYGEVNADISTLDSIPGRILGHDRYECGNDMVCGWAGSLGAKDGINALSGTGSMTYGERAGRGVRVGGWGELFGDEGSAYWVAIRGLRAFTQMSDGRLPVGPLHGIMRRYLDLSSDLDLIDVVLNRWKGARSEIAALSWVVVDASTAGDEYATRILTEAAEELVELVEVTRQRLGFEPHEKVPVSYSGGMFSVTTIREVFENTLSTLPEEYELKRPLFSPVVGAALYAAKLAGRPLDNGVLGRLDESQRETQARQEK